MTLWVRVVQTEIAAAAALDSIVAHLFVCWLVMRHTCCAREVD